MNKIHTTVHEGLDDIEKWISILRPISKNGAPIRHPLRHALESGPKTVALYLSFSIGPSGFRADFPLEILQSLFPAFYELGLRRIGCYIYSYDPRFDLEGKGLLSTEQIDRLEEICNDWHMDCDMEFSLSIGHSPANDPIFNHFHTELNATLLALLLQAKDPNAFLNLLKVRYYAHWLDVNLNGLGDLGPSIGQLKRLTWNPTRFF